MRFSTRFIAILISQMKISCDKKNSEPQIQF